jgi:heme-degrading monooxygenase HmoA
VVETVWLGRPLRSMIVSIWASSSPMAAWICASVARQFRHARGVSLGLLGEQNPHVVEDVGSGGDEAWLLAG